jgi:hypothetical protein
MDRWDIVSPGRQYASVFLGVRDSTWFVSTMSGQSVKRKGENKRKQKLSNSNQRGY